MSTCDEADLISTPEFLRRSTGTAHARVRRGVLKTVATPSGEAISPFTSSRGMRARRRIKQI